MDLKPGMLAMSKAGHDRNCIYVITDVKNEYVYLADGRLRPLARQKKKNRKHLQPITSVQAVSLTDDAAIRKILRDYSRERKSAAESMQKC